MRRRLAAKSHSSHERWLVSYADFITLLFAFFVVLYAFAKADQKRQADVSQAIDTAFKSLSIFSKSSHTPNDKPTAPATEQAVMPVNIVMGEDVLAPAQVKDDLSRIKHDLEDRLASQISQHTVAIKMGKDGLVISLREAGFFNSGSAQPRKESLNSMQQIAAEIAQMPYDLRVEGHTDDVPIHTAEFASNWELSSARATNVARTLLDLHAVSADRLSAAGYAEFHPVDTNDTPEGRGRNRRVDLVILPRTKVNFAADTAQPTGEWRKITDDTAAKNN
jgi:chemotaxis protein MotB